MLYSIHKSYIFPPYLTEAVDKPEQSGQQCLSSETNQTAIALKHLKPGVQWENILYILWIWILKYHHGLLVSRFEDAMLRKL